MGRRTILATALAAVFVTSVLTTGCAPTPSASTAAAGTSVPTKAASRRSVPATTGSTGQAPVVSSAAGGRHGGRGTSAGGSANGSPAAPALPADWPADLPIPAGTIGGSTGSSGRWTVLIQTAGSATDVLRSTVAFYSAAGFTPVSSSVLNRGSRQITLVVENLDHSATQTSLVVGVTTR